jgi:transaldolase
MCKKNIDLIRGRVLLQTLPSKCYDTEFTLTHARLYDTEFARVGITRDRYCIKIPSTGPALNAAKILTTEGIPTLGTALFGMPQAIACSQAGCYYISPYYNETRAHDELALWPNVTDPALEHPNSARVVQILDTYHRLFKETGKRQPLLKNASFITAQEAMAAGEMGCQSATISHTVLNELAKLVYDPSKQPGEGVTKAQSYTADDYYKTAPTTPVRLQKLLTVDTLSKTGLNPEHHRTDIDWLADGGKALDKAIEEDEPSRLRLKDAMTLFTGGENRSKAKIDAVLATL